VHHNDDYEGHGRRRVVALLQLVPLALCHHGRIGAATGIGVYSYECMKSLRMGPARWMAFRVHLLLTINAYHEPLEYKMFATNYCDYRMPPYLS
jgi:hypothetical protein